MIIILRDTTTAGVVVVLVTHCTKLDGSLSLLIDYLLLLERLLLLLLVLKLQW